MSILKRNFLYFLFAVGAVFYIEYLTPMHSDDFGYFNIGLDLEAHLRHYLRWSGRIVADYISGAVLLTGSKYVISLLIGTVVAGMCFMVADMPRVVLGIRTNRAAPFFIFTAYWICNTNLGQTTFWVVGASNYLWTNFIIISFLYLFFSYRNTDKPHVKALLFAVSLLAGCSNENTSLALIFLFASTLLIFRFYYHEKIRIEHMAYLTGIAIGAAVLLLCPGNYARAQHEAFAAWRNSSVFEKIAIHCDRVASRLKYFLMLVIPMVLSCGWTVRKREYAPALIWSALFLVGAVASLVVMVAAPSMPPRSFNGTLVLLLISASFLFSYCDRAFVYKAIYYSSTILFSLIFLRSFVLMAVAYDATSIQEQIRNSHIEYCKAGQIRDISIPGYYFSRLSKSGDKFDMYHNGKAMGRYFGVKEIRKYDVTYDYSAIRSDDRIKNIHDSFGTAKAASYKNPNFVTRKGWLALEVDRDRIVELMDRYRIEFMVDGKKCEPQCEPMFLSGKYYIIFSMGKHRLSSDSTVEVLYKQSK